MKKFNKKPNLLIFAIILTSFLIAPLFGFGLLDAKNIENVQDDQNIVINLDSSQSKATDLQNIDSSILLNFKSSLFDNSLKDYLSKLYIPQECKPKDVNIIVLFKDLTNKRERSDVIDSIFEDYKIIYNYNIIPGLTLKVNPYELVEKENELMQYSKIQKIYKSKTYKTPVIKDSMPKSNNLNLNDYDNWWVPAIGADSVAETGNGVRVAVIDSGIYHHSDLDVILDRNFVWDPEDKSVDPFAYQDLNGHGTHCAGLIGSDGGGSSGKYRGIAPDVDLINAKAGNSVGGLNDSDIINAIEWCVETANADIISMSFGGGSPAAHDPMTLAISNATDLGVICVVAAGNSGPGYFTGGSPASGIDAITVGASDSNNELASFSSWGPTFSYIGYPDVVAPGVDVISTSAKDSGIAREMEYIGNYFDFSFNADYYPLSGTSMATPVVAGALALLKEAYPSLTPEAARIALLKGAGKLSEDDDNQYLKSGAGLINVSASLEFLNGLGADKNDTAMIFPDVLPIKPYDLLNFPGDHQRLNLTVISAKANTFDVNLPDVDGITLSVDNNQIVFNDPGVNFTALDIKINANATQGIRNFEINITVGVQKYASINVSLDIRLPEHKILMESFHGLNDMYPDISFYQMGFNDAMRDVASWNISIDYGMDYWTAGYNSSTDNSILTEERLAQYDLVVMQNPILPYSPIEIDALRNYFNSGGNLLLLGTRYQDLCLDNLNHFLSNLSTGIEINEENIMDLTYQGPFNPKITSQEVTDVSGTIFQGVNKFSWTLGSTFTTTTSDSIAEINGKTVVASYNGTTQGKGKIVAFGDLYWLYTKYIRSGYENDHNTLLKNLMDYFMPEDDIPITIGLKSERTTNSQMDLFVYVKNQTIIDSIEVYVKNSSYSKRIMMDNSMATDGIYYNNTYNLPFPSTSPYIINVSVDTGGTIYNKTSKIIFVESSKVPRINQLSVDMDDQTRGFSVDFYSELSLAGCDVNGYMGIYSYSILNSKKTINKTLSFNDDGGGDYSNTFNIMATDPSGYAFTYIVPKSTDNYIDPYSPRIEFIILNYAPDIDDSNSYFKTNVFSETELYYYIIPQEFKIDFEVVSDDTEDSRSDLKVFITLFISTFTEDLWLFLIFPSLINTKELNYISGKHSGTYTIPSTLKYDTISGVKSISTETDFHTEGNYIGILWINVFDTEGGSDDFIIFCSIIPPESETIVDKPSGGIPGYELYILFGIIGIASAIILLKSKKKFE